MFDERQEQGLLFSDGARTTLFTACCPGRFRSARGFRNVFEPQWCPPPAQREGSIFIVVNKVDKLFGRKQTVPPVG